jgi:hypothetical protein
MVTATAPTVNEATSASIQVALAHQAVPSRTARDYIVARGGPARPTPGRPYAEYALAVTKVLAATP